MMQSRLAARWICSSMNAKHTTVYARFSSSVHRPADPGVHAGVTQGIDAEEAEKAAPAVEEHEHERVEDKPVFKNKQPFASSPKIETPAVNTPIEPHKQQKRRYNNKPNPNLEGVTCVGLDGFPEGFDDDRRRQEEDDKEYFKSRRPSPLSEVEVADTRKPVTKASDGSAASKAEGGVVLFEGEQLESAEETMMRGMGIWKENAMRGDPDAPHSRALREALRARGESVEW